MLIDLILWPPQSRNCLFWRFKEMWLEHYCLSWSQHPSLLRVLWSSPGSTCSRAAQRGDVPGAARAAGQIRDSVVSPTAQCEQPTQPGSPAQGRFRYSTPDHRHFPLFLLGILLAPCLWQGLTGGPLTPWHLFVCFPKCTMKTSVLWPLTDSSTLRSHSCADHCCHAGFSGNTQDTSLSQPH